MVTTAEVHDSQVLSGLSRPAYRGQAIYGDAAYRSELIEQKFKKRKMKSRIHKKGNRSYQDSYNSKYPATHFFPFLPIGDTASPSNQSKRSIRAQQASFPCPLWNAQG